MSTQREDYVMIGIDRISEVGDDFFDTHEKAMLDRESEAGDFGILYDGMDGKYAIFGKVLAMGTEYEGMGLNAFSLTDLARHVAEVREWLNTEYHIGLEPKLYAVTHWH